MQEKPGIKTPGKCWTLLKNHANLDLITGMF